MRLINWKHSPLCRYNSKNSPPIKVSMQVLHILQVGAGGATRRVRWRVWCWLWRGWHVRIGGRLEGYSVGMLQYVAEQPSGHVLPCVLRHNLFPSHPPPGQNHFPERLGRAVSYKPPMLFNLLWRAVSPFVDPHTRDKLVFLSPSSPPGQPAQHGWPRVSARSWGRAACAPPRWLSCMPARLPLSWRLLPASSPACSGAGKAL